MHDQRLVLADPTQGSSTLQEASPGSLGSNQRASFTACLLRFIQDSRGTVALPTPACSTPFQVGVTAIFTVAAVPSGVSQSARDWPSCPNLVPPALSEFGTTVMEQVNRSHRHMTANITPCTSHITRASPRSIHASLSQNLLSPRHVRRAAKVSSNFSIFSSCMYVTVVSCLNTNKLYRHYHRGSAPAQNNYTESK